MRLSSRIALTLERRLAYSVSDSQHLMATCRDSAMAVGLSCLRACRHNLPRVNIKAVLFDLDGTLYDRDALVRKVFSEQYNAFPDELCLVSKNAFVDRMLQLDDHRYADKAEPYTAIVRESHLVPEHLAERLVENFWCLFEKGCQPTEETLSTLQILRQRGIKLGVITNGNAEWQQRKLDALGITALLDAVLISESEGVRKPDAEIFSRALQRCGVESHEALFVGDNPEVDIAGAVNAGLRAAWKVVPYWPCAHEVPHVERLSEILQICDHEQGDRNGCATRIGAPKLD
jgi:putative hydrolase of the HAD superfamily